MARRIMTPEQVGALRLYCREHPELNNTQVAAEFTRRLGVHVSPDLVKYHKWVAGITCRVASDHIANQPRIPGKDLEARIAVVREAKLQTEFCRLSRSQLKALPL